MKKVNYFSGMRVRPEDLNTEQAYFEERIDTNMSVISNKGVVVDATLPDGTLLKYPYVWSDTKSLGVYGLIAYDEYGECIIVEPNFTKIDSDGDGQPDTTVYSPAVSNLTLNEDNELIDGGTKPFGYNKTYTMVIRYYSQFDEKSMLPVQGKGTTLPSRITRSFKLFLRDDNNPVLSGDVVLARVTTNSTGLITVDENIRDTFGIVNTLLRANVSASNDTSISEGSGITFEEHINMGGTGKWSTSNPHRMSAEDLGIDVAATGKHQLYLHSDGIKTDNIKSTTTALYPSYTSSSLTSSEQLIIQPLSDANNEIVVVNGVTINPGSLSEQYTMDFGNLVSESSEGFYLFAVNAESKSIVMQGPYESDTSELFLTALKDRRNFPICSLHWGKPFYSTYNIILQSVTAEYNQEGNVSEYGELVLTVPATYEFLDSNGNIVLAKDLVLKKYDEQTQVTDGTIVLYEDIRYWVIGKDLALEDADRFDIDPLSFKDRRVFNNTSFSDIRREDLCAIRDSAPFSNNTASIYYSRALSTKQTSYFDVGGKTLNIIVDGTSLQYTFIGASSLTKDQVLEQLNGEFNRLSFDVSPRAYITHNNTLAIVSQKSVSVQNGTANSPLGLTISEDVGEDVKCITYDGDLPSIQEMYYDINGDLVEVHYLEGGNISRSHKLEYSGDTISRVTEIVEVR